MGATGLVKMLVRVMVVLGFLSGCALFPGHYIYETHLVRSSDERVGDETVWFQFGPTLEYPSDNLAIYGNPYTLHVAVLSAKPQDGLRIENTVFRSSAGDTLFKVKSIEFELNPYSGPGKRKDGKFMFSTKNRSAPFRLPYDSAFTAEYVLRYPTGQARVDTQLFHWSSRRESHNRGVDYILSW